MTVENIQKIVEAWTDIYCLHLSPSSSLAQTMHERIQSFQFDKHAIRRPTHQYRYMQIFENKGAAMGCSNPHPHGQLWVVSSLPDEPALELKHLKSYQDANQGGNLLVDYSKKELQNQERIVFENDTFLTICPWWAIWPFEIMIVSKEHKRSLADLNELEKTHLAEAISDITQRYDNLFRTRFPYSRYSETLNASLID